jgi:hypothetical protein
VLLLSTCLAWRGICYFIETVQREDMLGREIRKRLLVDVSVTLRGNMAEGNAVGNFEKHTRTERSLMKRVRQFAKSVTLVARLRQCFVHLDVGFATNLALEVGNFHTTCVGMNRVREQQELVIQVALSWWQAAVCFLYSKCIFHLECSHLVKVALDDGVDGLKMFGLHAVDSDC